VRAPRTRNLRQTERLRVVHHDDVVLAAELRRVVVLPLDVDGLFLGRQRVRVTLERVVDRLRHGEEGGLGHDGLPAGHEPEVAQERHHRVQDLGHAAAVRRSVDVQDAQAAQRRGQPPQLAHDLGTGALGVRLNRPRRELD
jgi:hypothetical protein